MRLPVPPVWLNVQLDVQWRWTLPYLRRWWETRNMTDEQLREYDDTRLFGPVVDRGQKDNGWFWEIREKNRRRTYHSWRVAR